MHVVAYRFGPPGGEPPFVLRPSSRELLMRGEPQRLGARAFDLLLALVERAGELVDRDALFDAAWPGRVVIDDNLKVQMMGLRRLLGAEAIVTVPGRGYRFAWTVVREREAAPGTAGPAAAPAPRLIGREQDLLRLRAQLRPGGLVTVVGSGGVGKTKLATALVHAAGASFADGAAIVELAALTDARAVAAAVARQLKLPIDADSLDAGGLAQTVAPLAMLLVLDNCEHLLAGAAELAAAVLAGAPRIALVATSQQPLNLRGEAVLRLGGLAVPPPRAAATAEIVSSPAVALLAERVRARDPDFVVDDRRASAAARLVRRLDGIPLALEWAAARVPLLGLDGVVERLDDQLKLLARAASDAPTRQQTLRAALQWSHALLDAPQRAVFRRLGVFADSFTLETAEAVCTADGEDPWATLDALQALIDKSLVVEAGAAPDGAQRRWRLLVTAREFAIERLSEAGEVASTHERHADAVLAIFERSLLRLPATPLLRWLDALSPELPEMRQALRRAAGAEGDAARLMTLVALVGAVGPFWIMAGLNREAQQWLERVRPLVDEPGTPPLHAARYWQAVALRTADPMASYADAVAAAQRAGALYRSLGDAFGEYRMLGVQAINARRISPPLELEPLLERMRALERPDWSPAWRSARVRAEGIALSRAGDWPGYRAHFVRERDSAVAAADELRSWSAFINIAVADIALGRPEQAIADLEPVVQRLREGGHLRWQWRCAAVLMAAYVEAGAWARARAAMRETLSLLTVAGAPEFIGDHLAWWATAQGAAEAGALLLGWCDAAPARRKASGRDPHDLWACRRHEALLATKLPPERVAGLRESGRSLDRPQAVQMLLDVLQRTSAPDRA